MESKLITLCLIIMNILITNGCNKDEEKKETSPILETQTPTSITSNSAVVGGFVSSDGGATITERGVCYSSINPNPTVRDFVISEGNETGNYQCTLPDLDSETTYYAKAYALNTAGIGYGNTVSFTTEVAIIAPVATFTATPDSGAKPLSVSFNDQSTNNPTSWRWDFGDGGNSTQQNPVHIYDEDGTYTVKLTATNNAGSDSEEKNSFIIVTIGPGTVTDIDGNIYQTLEIGNQEWMTENLKVTHYSNGDTIPNVTNYNQWDTLTTGAYCWINHDISWKDIYGALYNWNAVSDNRELCPAGWHIPSDAEWTILTDYLGGEYLIGGKMKSTRTAPDAHPRWDSPNSGASNESGFSGLPGGSFFNGVFDVGKRGYFWSSSELMPDNARYIKLEYGSELRYRGYAIKRIGFSVRCLRD
ncbi:MAG: PKD domain-containing protein [Bacteroidales bacterium]|nr:PKD domain-containing protein [Bacteroidales bacterium]